jgi:nitrogen regulatory protein PII
VVIICNVVEAQSKEVRPDIGRTKMKQVQGIIYTKDLEKLSKALNAKGFIVQEVIYDGRRAINSGILMGIAYVYNLINRVKIRIVINDDLVGTLMDTLRSFGECRFDIFPEERSCLA